MVSTSQIQRIWSERFIDVYNGSGSQLNKYTFVKPVADYTAGLIPSVGAVSNYIQPPIAFLVDDLPDSQQTDLQLTTIRALEKGRIQVVGFDTTSATPGVTKVYCDNTGQLTLVETPFQVGIVIDAQVDGVLYISVGSGGAVNNLPTATYRQSFQNSDLVSGILTISHNLNLQFCTVQIFNDLNKKIDPDDITLVDANTVEVDLTTFDGISGSWNIVVVGTGTGVLAAPSTILSGNGVPSPVLGNDGDFYIDTPIYDIYGPKSGGLWGSGTSLQATVPDATDLVKGKLRLTGDLGGTADSPTVPGIELNAVINRYRRGYNDTGVTLAKFKFVCLEGTFFSTYPKIKLNDFSSPCVGVLTDALLTSTGAKILHYGLLQFDAGIIDTTAVPLNTPVYVSNTGDLTLSYTRVLAGHTASQGTAPWILLNVKYNVERYLEFPLVNVTNQTFNHNFGRYSSVKIINSAEEDITSSVLIEHSTNKLSLTMESNIPINGILICSCD